VTVGKTTEDADTQLGKDHLATTVAELLADLFIVTAVTVYRFDRPQSGGRYRNDLQQSLSVLGTHTNVTRTGNQFHR
jgi:hypothetical protein